MAQRSSPGYDVAQTGPVSPSSPIVKSTRRIRPWSRWLKLLLVVFALGVASYLSLATAWFAFARHRQGLSDLAWADLVLPSRWSRYRAALGRRQIETGRAQLAAGHAREALLYVRAGLARTPNDREGRLLLANLYHAARRPDAETTTLVDGLRYHSHDAAFLRSLFDHLLLNQEDQRVDTLARALLQNKPPSEATRVIALAAANANHLCGDSERAEEFLQAAPGLAQSCDGRLLLAQIAWDRGDWERALPSLRALAAEFPERADVHLALTTGLRDVGSIAEARRATLSFQLAHPQLAGPRLELLHAYRLAGDTARLAQEIETLLRDFSGDTAALLALGDFAVGAADVPLARRLVTHAEELRWSTAPFRLLAIEALVAAHDYRDALAQLQAALHEPSSWPAGSRSVFDCLQSICHFGLGEHDASRSFLARFLSARDLQAENLLAVADRFTALGATDQAYQVLVRAVEIEPRNSRALSRLVTLELDLDLSAGLPAHVSRLLALRRPSPELLRVAEHRLGGDRYLYHPQRESVLVALRTALAPNHRAASR